MEETLTPVDPTKLMPGTQIEGRFRGVVALSTKAECQVIASDGSTWRYVPASAKVYLVTPAS